MSFSRGLDLTQDYKRNIYSITLDLSGWESTTFQVLQPAGTVYIYGSNDAGAQHGITEGDAQLAQNFTTIQGTNLSTGSATTSITTEGNYKVDVNTQFIRLQGGAADVYRLYANHFKT